MRFLSAEPVSYHFHKSSSESIHQNSPICTQFEKKKKKVLELLQKITNIKSV